MPYSAKDHRLHLTISDGSYMVPMAQSASQPLWLGHSVQQVLRAPCGMRPDGGLTSRPQKLGPRLLAWASRNY